MKSLYTSGIRAELTGQDRHIRLFHPCRRHLSFVLHLPEGDSPYCTFCGQADCIHLREVRGLVASLVADYKHRMQAYRGQEDTNPAFKRLVYAYLEIEMTGMFLENPVKYGWFQYGPLTVGWLAEGAEVIEEERRIAA